MEAFDLAMRGYRLMQMLHVVAKLGVADVLAEGPRPVCEIATRVGADEDALRRLLGALADADVFRHENEDRFSLAEAGWALRSDAPDSVRAAAIMHGEPWWWGAWGGLFDAVRTGRTAFGAVNGRGLFEYLATHAQAARLFNASMSRMTAEQAAAIVAAYDFSHARSLIDVGGGHGALTAAVLGVYPHLRATLFDHPAVIEGAKARMSALARAGRCELVEGDFFVAVPAHGDIYTLKDILHDWDDDKALAILRNVRRAMGGAARLLVVERVLPANNAPSRGKLIDVAMLVLTGGRERTEEQYRRLLAAAGFALSASKRVDDENWLMEAAPVPL